MSNNDNAMARFLFAILQQKCLKDIDWNKVAHNPILAQEITNGHAARMRYSRFRAAMLGLEPQRRNRTNPNSKSRVSKKKNEGSPKPKKENGEKASGSGIGNIKTENTTAVASATIVKSEPKGVIHPSPPPSQPPAPMPTPAMMKTEPGLVNPHSQHLHHRSLVSAASPRIKHELPSTTATATNITPPMPEPCPFGMISTTPTSATSSPSTTPYLDGHYRMQMRLLTPCSDSDGMTQASIFSHSPSAASDLLQHGQHQRQHHQQCQQHHTIGGGSPSLSTASTTSPYDFSAHCCDGSGNGAPSPWHSPHAHHHHHHSAQVHHAHAHNTHHPSQPQNSVYSPTYSVDLGVGLGTGYTLDPGFTPFCGGHPSNDDEGEHRHAHGGGIVADPLGLHHHHCGVAAGAPGQVPPTPTPTMTTMFQERELETEMDPAGSPGHGGFVAGQGQGVKLEWEGQEGFEI